MLCLAFWSRTAISGIGHFFMFSYRSLIYNGKLYENIQTQLPSFETVNATQARNMERVDENLTQS